MRRRYPRPAFAATATLALLLTGCGNGDGGETPSGTNPEARVTVAYPAQPPNLDPMVSTTSATTNLTMNVWEGLITQDSDLTIQPMLAESWDISSDYLQYTFHLREGVMFHDGSELTSEDVVASMDRWSRLSGPGRAYFGGAEWSAEDDHTVLLDLEEPSFGVLLALSSDREQFAAVMPADIAEAAGDEPVSEIIGTGPFEFSDWAADHHLTLDRFEEYQPAGGEADGRAGDRTARVAGIDFNFVPDGSTRLMGLESGEYDITSDVPYDNVDLVMENDALIADSYPLILLNLYYNKAEGIFSDVEARRAVDTALDRESIMTASMTSPEFYTLTHSMMLDAQSSQWDSEVGQDIFNLADPETARAELDELDLLGEEVRIIATRDYEESYTSAVVIQDQLEDIGLNVTLETYDWPSFSEVRYNPSAYELATIPNTAKDDPGTLVFMDSDFAGFTDSSELDELLDEYRKSPSLEVAQERYDDLQQWYYEYLPVSKLGDAERVYAHHKHIDAEVIGSGIIWWSLESTQ